jgi:LuxR family maltose regulon positive regulatory protein
MPPERFDNLPRTSTARVAMAGARLRPPRPGAATVERERLEELLAFGAEMPFTLVVAPAGFGKSTLVAGWLAKRTEAWVWLNLGDDDRDLRRFVAHSVAAVRQHAPGFGDRLESLLQLEPLPAADALADLFVEEALELPEPLCLVWDDLHVAASDEVDVFVDTIVRYLEPPLRIIALSRVEPKAGLALARARGRVADVVATDLRMTEAEVAAVIATTTGKPAVAEAARVVHQRTEGWAACVRLAATTLRLHPDAAAFCREFGESANPSVLDFLLTEVVEVIRPGTRAFLLRTSIAERVDADLCAALMVGSSETADPQDLLDDMAAQEVYVTALDQQGQWYRFHPLFREALQARLVASLGAEEVRRLHAIASGWFEAHGLTLEAIAHAIAAGEPTRAGDLAAEAAFHDVERERWGAIAGWLRPLPDGLVRERADLLVARCWLDWSLGVTSGLADHVERAQRLLASAPATTANDRLRGHLATFDMLGRYASVGREAALAVVREAFAKIPAHEGVALGFAVQMSALALNLAGHADVAADILAPYTDENSVAPLGLRARASAALTTLRYQAYGDIDGGLAGIARLETLVDGGLLPVTRAWMLDGRGIAHLQRLELEAAQRAYQTILSLDPTPPLPYLNQAMRGLALCHQLAGRWAEASDFAEQAVQLFANSNAAVYIEAARSFQARIWLDQGNVDAALGWARVASPIVDRQLPMYSEAMALTRARVLFASTQRGDRDEGIEQLERYIARLRGLHLVPQMMAALAVAAMFRSRLGDDDAAMALLAEPLAFAATQRMLLPLVELGQPMASLLQQVPLDHPHREGADRALDRIWPATPRGTGGGGGGGRIPFRPEAGDTLTEREIEVLSLLGGRMTNREIGEQLFISPLTVKRHLANIFIKLAATERLQAYARGVDLGLVGARRGKGPRQG